MAGSGSGGGSPGRWRRSSRSVPTGDCVEVAFLAGAPAGGLVGLRDSKGSPSAVLALSREGWARFLAEVRAAG